MKLFRRLFIAFVILYSAILVPALSQAEEASLELKTGWNLVSLPITVSGDPGTVLGAFEYAVFRFDAETGSYVSAAGESSIAAGRGYWVYVKSDQSIQLSGTTTSTPQVISLKSGWNLVGAPFPESTPSTALKVDDVDFLSSTKTNRKFWKWNGTRYEESTGLIPGQGFWLMVNEDCALEITNPDAPPALAPPTNVSGQPNVHTIVDLEWSASESPDVSGYNVYLNGSEAPVNDEPVTGTSYSLGELDPGSSFGFQISAVDQLQRESELTDSVQVNTTALDPGEGVIAGRAQHTEQGSGREANSILNIKFVGGAVVRIPGTNYQTTTNNWGWYELKNVLAAAYSVQITYDPNTPSNPADDTVLTAAGIVVIAGKATKAPIFNIVSACGNSILEAGEVCDDGNTIAGDGCSSTCQIEYGIADFFPLNSGDVWTYERDNHVMSTMRNFGTETFNSVTAYKVMDPWREALDNIEYYYIDSGGLKSPGYADSNVPAETYSYTPSIVFAVGTFSKGASQNNSVTVKDGNSGSWPFVFTSTIVGTETVTVPAGTFNTVKMRLLMDYGDGSTETIHYWLAQGVGIVKGTSSYFNGSTTTTDSLKLVSAVVGGTAYGQSAPGSNLSGSYVVVGIGVNTAESAVSYEMDRSLVNCNGAGSCTLHPLGGSENDWYSSETLLYTQASDGTIILTGSDFANHSTITADGDIWVTSNMSAPASWVDIHIGVRRSKDMSNSSLSGIYNCRAQGISPVYKVPHASAVEITFDGGGGFTYQETATSSQEPLSNGSGTYFVSSDGSFTADDDIRLGGIAASNGDFLVFNNYNEEWMDLTMCVKEASGMGVSDVTSATFAFHDWYLQTTTTPAYAPWLYVTNHNFDPAGTQVLWAVGAWDKGDLFYYANDQYRISPDGTMSINYEMLDWSHISPDGRVIINSDVDWSGANDGGFAIAINRGVIVPTPECGNNIKEWVEECDDGGTTGGDGCSAHCTSETMSLSGLYYGVEFEINNTSQYTTLQYSNSREKLDCDGISTCYLKTTFSSNSQYEDVYHLPYTIASDGTVSLNWGAEGIERTATISTAGDILAYVDADREDSSLSIAAFVKASPYQDNSSISGTFHCYDMGVDTGATRPHTYLGEWVFDGDGAYTETGIASSEGGPWSSSGVYEVNPGGDFTADNGALNGMVSPNENFLAFTANDETYTGTGLCVKQGTGMSAASLSGSYGEASIGVNEMSGPVHMPESEYANTSFDGAGSGIYWTVANAHGYREKDEFAYSISSTGEFGDNEAYISADGGVYISADLDYSDMDINIGLGVKRGVTLTPPETDIVNGEYLSVGFGATGSEFWVDRAVSLCGGLGDCINYEEFNSYTGGWAPPYSTYTLESDRTFLSAEGNTWSGSGKISDNGDIAVQMTTSPYNQPDIRILVKKSSGNTNASVNGTYNCHGIGTDSIFQPELGTFHIRLIFDGAGGLTYQPVSTSHSTLDPQEYGTYSVSDDGTFTSDAVHGIISPDGQFIAGMDMDSNEYGEWMAVFACVKDGSGMSASSLSGDMVSVIFDSQNQGGIYSQASVIADVNCNGAGSYTSHETFTSVPGGYLSSDSGAYSVSANGQVNIDSVDIGHVKQDGKVFILSDVNWSVEGNIFFFMGIK